MNVGTAKVYVSDNQVDVSTAGWPLDAGASVSFIRAFGDDTRIALFAIAESGTQDVRVQEGWE
jgi:hypothetical protein